MRRRYRPSPEARAAYGREAAACRGAEGPEAVPPGGVVCLVVHAARQYRAGAAAFLGESPVFAIIQASGRQFRVEKDAVIAIDGHTGEAGAEVSFEQVLLVGGDAGAVTAGNPYVAGARVVGVIDGIGKTKKIRVFKKKRRKQYRRTKGHRSLLTRVRITDIQGG